VTTTLTFGLQVPGTGEPAPVVSGEVPDTSGVAAAQIVSGTGLLGPLVRDGKGDFASASGTALLSSNLKQVLGTLARSSQTRGEVPWRPEFGSLLSLLRFLPLDESLPPLARQYVRDALDFWMPQIRLRNVRVSLSPDEGTLELEVLYDVLSTRRVLVAANLSESLSFPVS
jgi:phage baseplate assembly protein W